MGLEGYDHLSEPEKLRVEASRLERQAEDAGRDRAVREAALVQQREELRGALQAERGHLDTGLTSVERARFEEAVRDRYSTSELAKEPRELGGIEKAIDRGYSECNALEEIVSLLEQRLEKVLTPEQPIMPGGERPDEPTTVGEHVQQIGDRIDLQVRRLMTLRTRIDV